MEKTEIKTLRCQIKQHANGKYFTHVTRIRRTGEIETKVVPTPTSQVRKPRVSHLWQPGRI